jgi:hypothetical protein
MKFFASLGYLALLPYAPCFEGQIVDAFVDFWMEYLQLGFYLMLSCVENVARMVFHTLLRPNMVGDNETLVKLIN